jgi:alkylation response protein AidB-like acyl-CoA dehydrogenase
MSQDVSTLPAWSALLDDPADARLHELATRLSSLDGPADEAGDWPEALWAVLLEHGASRWALPLALGGDDCGRNRLLQRYARIAEGSLTAAFILSQHEAGVRRLAAAVDRPVARDWLTRIAGGMAFTTVGISHLTTSRRLGDQPMKATPAPGGFKITGAMPWVTAACRADVIVTGAPLDDGRTFLAAVPADRPGLSVLPSFQLAAVQASCTAEVVCKEVYLADSDLLAGPATDVMSHPGAAGTGGLETSAIALGQARAALMALAAETPRKSGLIEPIEALCGAWTRIWSDLMATAAGGPGAFTPGHVRGRANALVLRATQAYLTARKGSGLLRTEPAQRWARQALFFLVWSCPGPVAQATIRDLVGLGTA